MSDKIGKLMKRHRAETARSAAATIKSALELNTDATLPEVRTEAEFARAHCTRLLQRLRDYEPLGSSAATALVEHARLATRINKLTNSMTQPDSALFELVAQALTAQSCEIASLRKQVENLLRGFADNVAKCEATVRFSVSRYFDSTRLAVDTPLIGASSDLVQTAGLLQPTTENAPTVEEPTDASALIANGADVDSPASVARKPASKKRKRVQVPATDAVGTNAAAITPAPTNGTLVVPAGPQLTQNGTGGAPSGNSVAYGSLFLRVGEHGNAAYSVSTRLGAPTIRGEPYSSYIALSLAREHGGTQMQSQTTASRSLLQQRRQAISRRNDAEFRSLVNPNSALLIGAQIDSRDSNNSHLPLENGTRAPALLTGIS